MTDTPPEPNLARIDELIDWAAAEQEKADAGEPSQWNQNVWVAPITCGTVCCIFGKLALDDGVLKTINGTLRVNNRGAVDVDRSFFTYGRDRLGLTDTEADALSDPSNDLDDLRHVRHAIAKGSYR